MPYTFSRAVVIGAGTMGAAIAAHLANAGLRVKLLDLPGDQNRAAANGLQRAVDARPPSFFTPDHARLVEIGNIEDDLAQVAEADWVLEAVVEDLQPKRELMARIDELRGARTVVSSNTSGIPLAQIAEGRSDAFKSHFLGTHFFNPPRYLKLLELIPIIATDPEILAAFEHFAERRLGKGVVLSKDRPGFLANRFGSVTGAFAMAKALELELSVAEVDALAGPLIGRPKTAVFRLLDLVGIDVAAAVRANLAAALPEDELAARALNDDAANGLMAAMKERGWLGNKSGVGFYKRQIVDSQQQFWALDLESMQHRSAADSPQREFIEEMKQISDLSERWQAILDSEGPAAEFLSEMLLSSLAYAAHIIPEAAELPSALDDAVRWGFQHELGPFELWDQLGVRETASRLAAAGYPLAGWVGEMLAGGRDSFYDYEDSQRVAVFNPATAQITPRQPAFSLAALKGEERTVLENKSASLIDLGEGVACLEFHSYANALDSRSFELMAASLDKVVTDFDALVIGNQAADFCTGANLLSLLRGAEREQWDELDAAVRTFQDLNLRLRYFEKPVVSAPAGRSLGGGAEILVHSSRVMAASESYIGLVETAVGLLPAAGGCKELLRRILNPAMQTPHTEPLPFLERIFEQIGQAQTSSSAADAAQMGYLGAGDRWVMDRAQVLTEARHEARHLADSGYQPPLPEQVYAAGRDALAALRVGIHLLLEGEFISEYDAVIGGKLALVLTGGELSAPGWVSEQHILDMEREAFLSLVGEQRTRDRIRQLLKTGKPLRN